MTAGQQKDRFVSSFAARQGLTAAQVRRAGLSRAYDDVMAGVQVSAARFKSEPRRNREAFRYILAFAAQCASHQKQGDCQAAFLTWLAEQADFIDLAVRVPEPLAKLQQIVVEPPLPAVRPGETFCILCNKLGHLTTECHSTHGLNTPYAREVFRLVRAATEPLSTFQRRVGDWADACFGAEMAAEPAERTQRFLEESLELSQACGITREEVDQLADYVFGRPVGEKAQEVGGVMTTLAALCRVQGLELMLSGEAELQRIWGKIDAIRAKRATKPDNSPLPQPADA